jgi:hypothetical protein
MVSHWLNVFPGKVAAVGGGLTCNCSALLHRAAGDEPRPPEHVTESKKTLFAKPGHRRVNSVQNNSTAAEIIPSTLSSIKTPHLAEDHQHFKTKNKI